MILKAFTLLDTKVGAFHAPFFVTHVAVAVRAVAGIASDPGTIVGRHPSDFVLCEVGSFDDQSGSLTSCLPIQHGVAVSFIEPKQEPLFHMVNEKDPV